MKATQQLHDLGQSLWLDNITRELLDSGTLKRYIDELSVTGLTSNPTIFDEAISRSNSYDNEIRRLMGSGLSGENAFFELAIEDLRRAADLFAPIHQRTSAVDGWVSLEVSPLLAYDAKTTVEVAKALHQKAARPNLFIKIPGTPEGRVAIEEAIFAGVSVNVTLLFSREHYQGAAEAYMRGLERRVEAGLSPDIRSVASLFVSGPIRHIAMCWTPIAGNAWKIWVRDRSGCSSPAPAPKIPRRPMCFISEPWLRRIRSTPCPKKLCWPSDNMAALPSPSRVTAETASRCCRSSPKLASI